MHSTILNVVSSSAAVVEEALDPVEPFWLKGLVQEKD